MVVVVEAEAHLDRSEKKFFRTAVGGAESCLSALGLATGLCLITKAFTDFQASWIRHQ